MKNKFYFSKFFWFFIYLFFSIIDCLIWINIRTFSNKKLLYIIRKKPWKLFTINSKKVIWEARITKILKVLAKNNLFFSSCLSRSIMGMILLDIFGINYIFNLGMTKNKVGKKIPHAWVENKLTGKIISQRSNSINLITIISLK